MPPTRVTTGATWKGTTYTPQEAKRLRRVRLERKRSCKSCNEVKHVNASTSSCYNNKKDKNLLTLPPIIASSTPRNSPTYLLPQFCSPSIFQEEEKAKLYLLWGRKVDIDKIRQAKNVQSVSQEHAKCIHCRKSGHKDMSDSRCPCRR